MSQNEATWTSPLSDASKASIKDFTDPNAHDSIEQLRSIAEFTNGGGGGTQSYPLTVSEASRITVKFHNASTGDEITEAPAGEIVQINCGSLEGNSGSLSCTDQGDNYTVFEKSGYLGEYDIYTAVPIGGLTATVYVD